MCIIIQVRDVAGMRKRLMQASLVLMALCIYLQWGRGVSVRNTISSSWDGKRTEHMTIVANKLYIGDKEAFARKMIETCINNEFRDVRFSYDMGYPAEITMDIYTNETARQLGVRCCEVRYAQPEEDRSRYNVKDDRERFVMTVKWLPAASGV